ncbi:uroporphyrinogen decarboxylase [Demequina activiva]|uniref:Uroporphyrinogen decarboxylase n=1 Tax=Demequina activiva TaxID=1582364 RepID=A0A919UJC1_9MICO|nr:uroporphyrinogen decarboxylase [Demequina activiva]GIG53620.1 uroporphyrinogen decarboxylase [Demequina activiva]
MTPSALPSSHPLADGRTATSPLIAALTGGRPDHRPVWFMRQAGRSLPEYQEARAGTAMLDACLTPGLASEITLQPVRRYGVDAAIFFSDIVVPMRIAGVEVDIKPGVGPVFARPIRTMADVEALPSLGVAGDRGTFDTGLDAVRAAVEITVDELDRTPLIGFAGAPFTLAAYMVDGRPSRDHLGARELMHTAPDVWQALVRWTAKAAGLFLRAQVLAGASAIQLFDSWAGSLSARDYAEQCQGGSHTALMAVADLDVPRIHFAANAGHLLIELGAAGATALGVDYRTPLDIAAEMTDGRFPLQGNIDPAMLAAPRETLERHVLDVLRRGEAAPGHVVNLGHGMPPHANPDVVKRIVDLVHERG